MDAEVFAWRELAAAQRLRAEKIREAVAIYRKRFEEREVPIWKYKVEETPASVKHVSAHCHWLLGQVEKILETGDIEKANLLLGFVHGCLWNGGIYTIPELQQHL